MDVGKNKTEVEEELKIYVTRKDLESVFNFFVRKVGKKQVLHKYMPRAYFDTEDLKLFNAEKRKSCRVQYVPGKVGNLGYFEQTIKFEIEPDRKKAKKSLYRKECKNVIAGHLPNVGRITDEQARKAMSGIRNKDLRHIFTASLERRYFNMDVAHKGVITTVEMAFDVGHLILPERNVYHPFAEIEIEMKKGDSKILTKVKKQILAHAPSAKIQMDSKSRQGVKLYLRYKNG